jgi:hypothetical protein
LAISSLTIIKKKSLLKKSEKNADQKNTDSTPSAEEPVPKNTNESNIPVKPARNTHPDTKGWSQSSVKL